MTSSLSTKEMPPGHMPALDGLRGLAILVVMLHHFLPPNYPNGIPSGAEGFFIKIIYRLFDVGWWGVDLFFVLSGFLITGILLSAKNSPHFFRNFYARRSLRIFPLYYALLIFLFVILPFLARQPSISGWVTQSFADYLALGKELHSLQSWLWLYGVNIKIALEADGWIFTTLTHFWSLAVEEHFYFVWPIVVYFAQPKYLVKICLIVALGSILLRLAFLLGGLEPAYIFILTPCRLDGLVLGAMMAVLFQSSQREEVITKCRRALPFLLLLSIAAILTLERFGPTMIIFGHALLACLFAAIMPIAATITKKNPTTFAGWFCNPLLSFFGKYSYGIYLLHPFVFKPMERFLTTPFMEAFINDSYELLMLIRASLGITFAVIVAYVSWHLFEKHFLKLKHFFPSGRSSFSSTMAAKQIV